MSTTSPSIEDLLKKSKTGTTASSAKTKKGRTDDDVTVEEKLEKKLGALDVGDEEMTWADTLNYMKIRVRPRFEK